MFGEKHCCNREVQSDLSCCYEKMTLYQGKLEKEDLIWTYDSRRVHKGRGGMAAAEGLRKLRHHIFNHKRTAKRVDWKWERL